jgi:hypothetical protein
MHHFHTRFHRATMLVVACAFALSSGAVAQTWSSPQLVTNGNGLAVATNGSGTSAVIFTPTGGGLQASIQSGGVWVSPTTLTSNTAAASIAVAPNGDALAVWVFRTTNTYIPNTAQARFYSAGHWGSTITISANVYGNVSSTGLPSIGFDSRNQATLIWEEIANPTTVTCGLKAETGNAASGFGSAQTISSASTCFGWTRLAINSGGQAVAVEGAAGILSAAVVAISRDASGTWGVPVTVGAAGVYRQRQPKVGLGNEGTAVLVYLINGGVRYSVRSGGVWSAAATLPGISGGASGAADVAVDGSGNAVATFGQTTISPGTYATYRPVGGSFQTKAAISGSGTQLVATPAGTFVAGGTTVSTRLAGSSAWNQKTFANPQIVNAAAGLAIAVGAPQVSVATAAVP